MATISVAKRRRLHPTSFGLPKEDKYVINTKQRAISAIAYAVKNTRDGNLTPAKRDLILRKVHKKYPDIKITPTRGFKIK